MHPTVPSPTTSEARRSGCHLTRRAQSADSSYLIAKRLHFRTHNGRCPIVVDDELSNLFLLCWSHVDCALLPPRIADQNDESLRSSMIAGAGASGTSFMTTPPGSSLLHRYFNNDEKRGAGHERARVAAGQALYHPRSGNSTRSLVGKTCTRSRGGHREGRRPAVQPPSGGLTPVLGPKLTWELSRCRHFISLAASLI